LATEEPQEPTLLQRYARVGYVFTPGAPVDSYALFAGRLRQIRNVVDAINQRGRHVVLFGERGVGKTSLANILPEVFMDEDTGEPLPTVKVNCSSNDDFHTLWNGIFREMERADEFQSHWTERPPDPEDVRYLLERHHERLLIVIDELDRFEDQEGLSLLADTIKSLSDHSVDVTLVLVGVADSIEQLVGDHRSVERAISQIRMQRMSLTELKKIVNNGLKRLNLKITTESRNRIARLSEGLPYYTHSLALHAAQRAVLNERMEISGADVQAAIEAAVTGATHSIEAGYQTATRSTRKESQFKEVLLACALAPKEQLGFFTARDVREPLSKIMGRRREIPSFARHLKKFAEPARGCVLQKQDGRFYRFENPLLQTFVVLSGLATSLISEDLLTELQDAARMGRSEGLEDDDEA
jgi:Cdc6-like AAA superfamily ATPase